MNTIGCKLNYEQMEEYLENAGYCIDNMHSDEIDCLAMAEGFTYNEDKGLYYYQIQ